MPHLVDHVPHRRPPLVSRQELRAHAGGFATAVAAADAAAELGPARAGWRRPHEWPGPHVRVVDGESAPAPEHALPHQHLVQHHGPLGRRPQQQLAERHAHRARMGAAKLRPGQGRERGEAWNAHVHAFGRLRLGFTAKGRGAPTCCSSSPCSLPVPPRLLGPVSSAPAVSAVRRRRRRLGRTLWLLHMALRREALAPLTPLGDLFVILVLPARVVRPRGAILLGRRGGASPSHVNAMGHLVRSAGLGVSGVADSALSRFLGILPVHVVLFVEQDKVSGALLLRRWFGAARRAFVVGKLPPLERSLARFKVRVTSVFPVVTNGIG